MEHVRIIMQFFGLNVNLFIPFIISAIFIILVSIVYRKILKKSVKVHCRQTVNLSSDTLHDILAFFNRKSLSRLRSVDSRFNQTIQREFANKPYLLLNHLFYSNRKCYVCLDYGRSIFDFGRYINDRNVVDQILAAKFVLFDFANVECDDHAGLRHFLSKNGNPLRIFNLELSKNYNLTTFRARRLAKCKNFDSIAFHGRMTVLAELLSGNFLQLQIWDHLFATADSVPWSTLVDFLFRPCGTEEWQKISIVTKNPPNEADFLAFTDSVRQRFLAARNPLFFDFSWFALRRSFLDHIDNDVHNTHTGQCLAMDRWNMFTC
ncbi:hypothetical protein DdX_21992 [Ditylenchus destructor]|uniref:F-box domain-containing protein n=1 Tax=Ditylenchus destructor TaxID=166010 RepID=A0AAD4ME55_9BILA|nr:hypothetical protein DdX_21992 [Ditylenchus destructor]